MIEEKSVKYGGSIATNAEFREQNKNFEETIKNQKNLLNIKEPLVKSQLD